jgi:hypothetical protein
MTDTTLGQPILHDDDAPADELPRRAPRKLVTTATAGLAAVIIAAAGFVAGVEVQKGSATASTGAGSATGAGARQAGFAGGAPGAAGRPSAGSSASGSFTTGQVKSKDGSTLYVTDADGNMVKVKTTSNSKVSRNASASAGAIHPGDTVVIQGTTAADGTVKATSVSATASGVTPAGGGFPGGRAAGSGATTPGTTTSNGGTP